MGIFTAQRFAEAGKIELSQEPKLYKRVGTYAEEKLVFCADVKFCQRCV